MHNVRFLVDGAETLSCRSLRGTERLGQSTELEFDLFSTEGVAPADVVGKPCAVVLEGGIGARVVGGIVTRFSAVATANPNGERRYRATVHSRLAAVELRTRSRIFQKMTIPDIVKKVLLEAGYDGRQVELRLYESHIEREYVVQYAENDAAFVRRMCEDEGLVFRFDADEEGVERIVLEDATTYSLAALEEPLPLVDVSALGMFEIAAFDARILAKRRPGKVTLRDYNHEKPDLALSATSKAGTDVEQSVEVYEGPGGFREPDEGDARARLRLETLRADALELVFRTTAVALTPGLSFTIEAQGDYAGSAKPAGKYTVVAVEHQWTFGDARVAVEVRALPRDTPYRLPRTAARPRLTGVQSAFVTGAAGEEIHTDAQGRIKVQFPWDLEGKGDEKATLPIRVMQPNMPGSMAIPRVGWEVLVAFEDGDPEKPVVLGRTYNAKFAPPYQLPANKTVTALQTYSSPGSGGTNSIRFDDAAGRQHVFVQAQFGKSVSVSNDMVTQTVKNENVGITGSQTRTVGGNENVSVTQAYRTAVGSQSATVGGEQEIYVKGHTIVGVGSESVLVGAAVLEKVGNPVNGLLNLAKAAAMSGAGALGQYGQFLAAGGGLALSGYEGYKHGGAAGALKGVGLGAVGIAAGMIPGGEAIFAVAQGAAQPAPWREGPPPSGDTAGGGGGTGASDNAGAGGPGPGHRNTSVKGAMTEIIAGASAIVTPGDIGWYTVGPSSFLIGGSYTTKTARGGVSVLGASSETLGSLKIDVKGVLARDVKGPVRTTIAGALSSQASGKHTIKAGGALTIEVGGSLTLQGGKVSFNCGGATITASESGVLIEAGTITINRSSKQSGVTGHT
ncbi:type VI secretion system Vgr family protein [Polyangium sorediatum]|uniref:Type VI secretion system tip protein TssI/VgrG n=1 Tax=Polyangium sorediatum TaxID=889274 RepID=A0ABT6NLA4_9BACT|nr:type VI secretion system tip protein TssI/VgrG [Polyangium sorediatum]MDI1429104.1 type VI secretion system tip protein TssI/VgrG [Polyangium sorediatum]